MSKVGLRLQLRKAAAKAEVCDRVEEAWPPLWGITRSPPKTSSLAALQPPLHMALHLPQRKGCSSTHRGICAPSPTGREQRVPVGTQTLREAHRPHKGSSKQPRSPAFLRGWGWRAVPQNPFAIAQRAGLLKSAVLLGGRGMQVTLEEPSQDALPGSSCINNF